MTREITSNKIALLIQASAIVMASALAATVLEYSGLLRTSVLGRVSAAIGLPVAGTAIALVGVAIAVATIVDSWTFTIRLNETGLEIEERLGRSQVAYANILGLKLIPAYGAGIALKDKDEWLNGFTGTAGNRAKVEQISGVVSAAYGCDVLFVNKRLGCGSKAFLDHLSSRTGIAIS
jgi:hypothetical protein